MASGFRMIGLALGLVGSSCLSTAALAQSRSQAAPTTPTASNTLTEVIVTAERRSSTVQKTPISITALSGADLQKRGIESVSGLIAQVPGISARSSGPGQTEIEMRGLASSGGAAPTVGYYLDETALTPPAVTGTGKVVLDPSLFDLNRVEVLRGPQGTLYGSGSMGGTIRLIPNTANADKFEAAGHLSVSGTQGGGANPGVDLMGNFPLVQDKAALRVVFSSNYDSGWIDRVVVNNFPVPTDPCGLYGTLGCNRGDVRAAAASGSSTKDGVNWSKLFSGRVNLLLKPIEHLTISTTGMIQNLNLGGFDNYDQNPGQTNKQYSPYNIGEPVVDQFRFIEINADYDLKFADLVSTTAYWVHNQSETADASEGLEGFFSAYYGVDQFYPVTYTETDKTSQFSQELRMASKGEGRFSWILGGYFSQYQSTYGSVNNSLDYAPLSTGGVTANPEGIIYGANSPYHIRQLAAYGNVGYKLTDSLRVSVGLRYYDFNTKVDQYQNGIATLSGNATPTISHAKTTNTGLNPKFDVSYQPTNQLNVYASAAKGFRPGGVNNPIPSNLGCTLNGVSYQPDSVWTYELGEKTKLWNNRLTINSDFYYTRWSNVQQLINQACGYTITTNAGTAEAYGPESEVSLRLTDTLTLAAAGAYTKADLTTISPLVASIGTLSPGARILNIPDYTGSGTLTDRRPISGDLFMVASMTDSYVGSSIDASTIRERLPAYNLLSARLGLERGRWSAYLFVDNLTDTHAQLSINTTQFQWPIPSLVRVSTNQPRTIGVDFNVRY